MPVGWTGLGWGMMSWRSSSLPENTPGILVRGEMCCREWWFGVAAATSSDTGMLWPLGDEFVVPGRKLRH